MIDRDPETGRFLPGNRFWQARSSHGRKPTFATADDLWDAVCEYFEWVEQNPLYADQLVTFQGMATHVPVAKMRAMTLGGLCIFLDVAFETWKTQAGRGADFLEVVTRAEEIIRTQKFEGAAADLLNSNIIARDLGLAEKRELSGRDGGPIQTEDVTRDAEQFAGRMARLAAGTSGGGDGEAGAGGQG